MIPTLLEVAQHNEINNFDTLMGMFAKMADKSGITKVVGNKGWDAMIKLDELSRVPASKFPLNKINSFLGPLGLISNEKSFYDALFRGTSEFAVKLDPRNKGTILRRAMDYSFPNQKAE
ncbi:MAG: hypothetical protein H0U39_13035, partial [Segetibacter sp.]|nr:hypothetical protein [Segetibacter sp.]